MVIFITILILAVIVLLVTANSKQNSNSLSTKQANKLKQVDKRYVTITSNDNGEIFSSFNFSFEDSNSMKPHLIVVDLETSGLRKFRNKDPKNLSNWPRIVQISWKMFDIDGGLIEDRTEIFKQPRSLPMESVAIHGITDEICKEKGVEPVEVLNHFLESCSKVKYLVGHNIKFDHDVIEANMRRFKITDDFEMNCKCTMNSSERLLALKSNFSGKSFKSPNLSELVNFLFYGPGVNAEITSHDAEKDVNYTARCYFELRERGIMD